MDNINREILRPIGILIISGVGLLSIFFFFNKIFLGISFGLLIVDSVTAISQK